MALVLGFCFLFALRSAATKKEKDNKKKKKKKKKRKKAAEALTTGNCDDGDALPAAVAPGIQSPALQAKSHLQITPRPRGSHEQP